MSACKLYLEEFKYDLKNYKWLIISSFLIAFLLSSVTIYGFAYNGFDSIFSIGTSSPQGEFMIGSSGTTNSLFTLGTYNVTPPTPIVSQNILFILLPIIVASMAVIVMVLRMKASHTVKAMAITMAMAIILVIGFLIIQGMLASLMSS